MTHLEEYNKIIDYRKTHPLDPSEYGEKHHIKPRSLYPDLVNDPNNIVRLSAAEHFVAHYHLWKYYKEELKDKTKARSMCFAFTMMKRIIQKSNDIEKMSLLYSEVREEYSLSQKGKKVSEEARKKMSENNSRFFKGKHHSEETKRKLSKACKGYKHTEEAKRKISETHKGKPSGNKGKPFSEETKRRMSESQKGHFVSEETKKKISDSLKGHVVSEESKRKMSEAKKTLMSKN